MRAPKDLYAVAKYPKAGFRNEAESQRIITSRMKTKDKRILQFFFSWVAIFFGSLLFGLLGLPAVLLAGMALLFFMTLLLSFLLLYAPAPTCPQCGMRMKRDWARCSLDRRRAAEFMICSDCHLYLYTHRTQR